MLNTNYVSTRWYWAPECLLSSPHYGKPSDVFALGCILAEFVSLKPLFTGASSLDQFYKYCEVLGSPTQEEWTEGHSLSHTGKIKIPFFKGTGIKKLIPGVSEELLDLILKMLKFNPDSRPSAKEILKHPFISGKKIR